MTESVLGYLATRFTSSSENLATEALNFILGKSLVARQALVDFISQASADLPTELIFKTQAIGDDDAIPDLIGFDVYGNEIIIGESKFWAGLTSNQPVTYLNRLPKNKKSVLLFIAPAQRLFTLWPELLRRCSEAEIPVTELSTKADELLAGKINAHQTLALCSWGALLSRIYSQTKLAGLPEVAEDTQQLMGLCESMDTQAFLPLQSEELALRNGLRFLHFREIADGITETLVSEKIASIKRLKAGSSFGRYVRYMIIGGYAVSIGINIEYWTKIQETPLWMTLQEVKEKKWVFPVKARELLSSLEAENPARMFVQDDQIAMPLYLPIGKEKADVIAEALQQVKYVLGLLAGDNE